MQDLLTGNRRVTAMLLEQREEVTMSKVQPVQNGGLVDVAP